MSNEPTITPTSRYATWAAHDSTVQGIARAGVLHRVAAHDGAITITISNGAQSLTIASDMVPWFADSIAQAAAWIEEEKDGR